jgi:hypothetical protein
LSLAICCQTSLHLQIQRILASVQLLGVCLVRILLN